MTSPFSEDDIRQITTLIQTLDRSTFDFLQVEIDNVKSRLARVTFPGRKPAS
jgi:hypothetical protein